MKTWRIPVYWRMMGTVVIEADTLADAIYIAGNGADVGLPDDGYYVEGSFGVDDSGENYIRAWYNFDQKDDEEDTQNYSSKIESIFE